MVALWRARAAIARRAEIGACLQCARRQLAARTTGAIGKLAHSGRVLTQQPVPEARAGRRVGIVAGDSETFCPLWRARPLQVWRLVAASAAKAEMGQRTKSLRR